MKILDRKSMGGVYLMPGDSVVLSCKNDSGQLKEVLRHTLTEAAQFDEAVLFASDDFCGMTGVIGGAFGKKQC